MGGWDQNLVDLDRTKWGQQTGGQVQISANLSGKFEIEVNIRLWF